MKGAWQGFADFMSQGIEGLKGAVSGAQAWLESTFMAMQATATAAMAALQEIVMSAVTAIVAAAQSLWNQLVGHSIWTDMLEEMQAQTASALGNIVSDFQGAFGDITFSAPVAAPAPYAARPEAAAPMSTMPSMPQSQNITVLVTLDGQVLTKHVEHRFITKRETIPRGRYTGE